MQGEMGERLVTAVAVGLTCLLVVLCLLAGFGPWGAFVGTVAGLAAWARDQGPSSLKRLRTTDGDVARVYPDDVRGILDRGHATPPHARAKAKGARARVAPGIAGGGAA